MKFSVCSCSRTLQWLLLVLLCAAACTVQAAGIATAPIQKSENDGRDYHYFHLPNQMQVLLISDPETDKAAVSLDVNVGSGDDPASRPGLAHFLEHMLFLGTAKYPQADDYHQFIDRHGGQHNAFTSLEHTNYHFDIDPRHLEPALDRFAQFFIQPLMDDRYVERERNAVHAEYMARIQDESRRSWDVYREIFDPANKSATYGVGNKDTLADRGEQKVKKELLAFYEQHYSANLMSLVVLGNAPLADLQSLVEKYFAAVPNNKRKLDRQPQPLFADGVLPARLFIKPLQEQRELSLTFPIPPFEQYYREKPVEYLAYLLGHEGEGSLLDVWKNKGWVESLAAGTSVANRQSAAFALSLSLTEDGYQHVEQIIAETFQMIRQLEAEGIQRWRYNEQSVIQSTLFRYQEKGDALRYAITLANNLQYYPPADVIQGPVLSQHYDEALIRQFLQYLRPDNVLVEINAPDVRSEKNSQYYQTPYRLEKITTEQMTVWQQQEANPALRLPLSNEFVAKNFNLKRALPQGVGQQASDRPRLLREQANLKLWHHQDQTYRVPRGGVLLYARSEAGGTDARAAALTSLWVRLLNRHINSVRYAASLAGLELDIEAGSRGINVSIDGFSDKQGLLLTRTLEALVNPAFSQRDLDKEKEELLRVLHNRSVLAPYQQLNHAWQSLLSLNEYPISAYQQEVTRIELKDVQEFSQKWLRSLNADLLIFGNVTQFDALKLGTIIESKLSLDGRPRNDPPAAYVNVSAGLKPLFYALPVDHPDVATLHYFQGADDSVDEQARMSLLAQILRADFYNQLRTEQQLGYIVGSGYFALARVPGLGFVVQSTTHGVRDIDQAVLDFLGHGAERLAKMPAAEFEQHRSALLHVLEETPKSLSEQGDRWWRDINTRYLDFDHREQLITAVSALSQKTLADYYWKTLLAPQKKSVLVAAHPPQKALDSKSLARFQVVDDVSTFKQDKKYFVLE